MQGTPWCTGLRAALVLAAGLLIGSIAVAAPGFSQRLERVAIRASSSTGPTVQDRNRGPDRMRQRPRMGEYHCTEIPRRGARLITETFAA
jgi:hypothetical protein